MNTKHQVLVLGAALLFGGAAMETSAAYIAGTWSDTSLHFLDSNFASTGSFAAGAGNPNGVAVGGGLIWSGHFTNQSVIAYNFNGVQQFSWSDSNLSGLQGLAYIDGNGGQIAAASGGNIYFFEAMNGTLQGQFVAAEGGTIEGLAYNGAGILFQLGTNAIYATDVTDGTVLYTLTNPAIGDPFGGTGLAYNGLLNVLAVAGANGNWYEIDPVSGALLASGNNGLDMYGLAWIPAPGAVALLGVAGLFGVRRRRR